MIQHIRILITSSYDLLHSSPDFAFIRAATSKAEHIDDNFLRLTKELAILKADLREDLTNLSGTIEEIEVTINHFKSLIQRKEENIKNLKNKIN